VTQNPNRKVRDGKGITEKEGSDEGESCPGKKDYPHFNGKLEGKRRGRAKPGETQ